MNEEWRDIPGWPLHQASSLGRVKSKARWVRRFNSKRNASADMWRPERILKLQTLKRADDDKVSALTLGLSRHGDGRAQAVYVHHLILMAFIGPRPDGLIGCHNDGDPTNNIPSNLRWDTHASNNADAIRHGTAFTPPSECGSKSPAAKLTDAQIVEIVESPWGRRGIGNKLAKRFGVGNTAIYEARKRYAKRPDLYSVIKERARVS